MDHLLKLDWLSFTYQVSASDCLDSDGCIISPFQVFCNNFPELGILYDSVLFDTGKFHYSHRYIFSDDIEINCCELEKVSGGQVNFDYACKMGVNVSIPSHSLSLFASLLGFDINDKSACCDLLALLKFRGCKFSRIDFCYDDFDKVFTAFDFARWWTNDQICTRFKNCDFKSSQSKVGGTFYLGDRRHHMVRIYDKFYESKGVIDSVRYEWEYHSSDAVKLADFIIVNSGKIGFTSLLDEWFRVLVPNNNSSNRSEVATLPEWSEFIEKRQFSEELIIPEYNVVERETSLNSWVQNICLKSVKGYIASVGLDTFFSQLKRCDMSKKYIDYTKKMVIRGFTPFNIEDFYIAVEPWENV